MLTSVKESTASPQLTDTTPTNHLHDWHDTTHPFIYHRSHSSLAEEDWHMPIESSQYFIILFRVNQVFTFYHFIAYIRFNLFNLFRYFIKFNFNPILEYISTLFYCIILFALYTFENYVNFGLGLSPPPPPPQP